LAQAQHLAPHGVFTECSMTGGQEHKRKQEMVYDVPSGTAQNSLMSAKSPLSASWPRLPQRSTDMNKASCYDDHRHAKASPGGKDPMPQTRFAIISDDVEPAVALAKALQQRTSIVRVFGCADQKEIYIAYGLDFVPVFGAKKDVMKEVTEQHSVKPEKGKFKEWSKDIGTPLVRAEKHWIDEHPGVSSSVMRAVEDFKPDVLIALSVAILLGSLLEQAHGVPAIYVFNAPGTVDHLKALAYRGPTRPSFYPVCELLDNRLVKAPICRTDFWAAPHKPEDSEFKELQNFLSQGKGNWRAAGSLPGRKVMAINWGIQWQEGMSTEELLLLALRILHRKGCLGVIIGGWSGMDKLGRELVKGNVAWLEALVEKKEATTLTAFATFRVCFVEAAPHAWLLPQCWCFLHQGCLGPMHAALRATCPSIITPSAGNDFLVARRTITLDEPNVGIAFHRKMKEISIEEFMSAIDSVVKSRERSASDPASKPEQGRPCPNTETAADIIDAFARKEALSGSLYDSVRKIFRVSNKKAKAQH